MSSSQRVRLAVVGLGKMGLSHFAIANATAGVEVVAVSDSSKLLQEGFSRYIGVETYSSFEKLIARTDLDGVIIATPTRTHYDMVKAALDRGLHVFCEKPMTLSGAQSRALADQASASGRVGQVGYHNRFVGTFGELKRLIAAGALGPVRHISAEAYGPVVLKPTAATWRSDPEAGGGCLYDYAAHPINLMTWLGGPALACTGAELPEQYSSGVEDAVYASLRFAGGTTGQVSVNWSDDSHRKMTTKITVWGDGGKVTCDRQELQAFLNGKAKVPEGYNQGWTSRYITDLTPPVGYYLRGEEYSAQIEAFRDAVASGGAQVANDFASAAETDETLELIRRRFAEGPPLAERVEAIGGGKRGLLARLFGG